MFRQVVAYRWSPDASEADRAAFIVAVEGLRAIPELTQLTFGEDDRHFEGNHDFVAVMDFPDFAAARRYVADERHQAYIRDHASQVIAERVVVQHDWATHEVAGVQHVCLPVSHVARSRDWYVGAFGLVAEDERHEGGLLTEATLRHVNGSGLTLVLVADGARAAALSGFSLLALTVANDGALRDILARLDVSGIAYGERTAGPAGVFVDVPDPDHQLVRLVVL